MSSHLKHRILTVLALAFTAPLAACGYSVTDLCDDACECQGCSDAEYEECVDEFEDAERQAENEGCSDQADEYLSCISDEAECRSDGRFDVDGCEFEARALGNCLD